MGSRRKITIKDILRLININEPRVSSKGDLAFTITRNDLEKNKVFSEIHVVRRDGVKAFLVGESDSQPRWSPDARVLAFTSRRGAKEEEKGAGIFVWTGVGEPRRIVWFKYGVERIEWLDNNKLVAVVPVAKKEYRDEEDDYVVTDKLPLWFDGKGLVAGFEYTIILVDVESGYIRELVREEEKISDIAVCQNCIYYTVPVNWRTPTVHKIVSVDPETKEKEIVLEGYSVGRLKCLGEELYALMHRQEIGIASHYRLWRIEDKKPVCLTCSILDRNIYDVPGELEGNPIITYADRGQLLLARLDRNRIEVLAGTKGYVHSAHADAGKIAYVLSTPTRPQELYLYSNGEYTRITRFNTWLIEEVELYEPEHLDLEILREKIDGWTIIPGDGEEKKPLILYIHGGPKGMYGYYFHPELQLMAAEGFAVAYANPHGSDGYSEEFADIRGRYGEIDYEQLMKFLDYVLEKYSDKIDPTRLAVTGISYGGYMTNVVIAKTNRFKAAVSENGIADWIADYWASDIGYWFDPDQIGKTPLENMKEYIEKSPVYQADRIQTPVLIIHSMEDYRCFIDQALALHTALVMKGKESKLVVFTKGSHAHSLRGKPKHREKRYKIKIKWLKEKLNIK